MIYPSLDYTMTGLSIKENAEGYLLQKEKILWYFDNNFQGGENRKTASPPHGIHRKDPETLVITAELPPLR